MKALLAEADADQLAFDRIAAITGTRRGETGALRWSDLDWETRALEIDEALKIEWVEISGQEKRRKSITVGPTKTHSERTVMLDSATVEILREFRGYQESRAKACGVTLAEDPFIFSDDVEGRDPVDPDKWSARWRRPLRGGRQHDGRGFGLGHHEPIDWGPTHRTVAVLTSERRTR